MQAIYELTHCTPESEIESDKEPETKFLKKNF
jgi:hypothetical protein